MDSAEGPARPVRAHRNHARGHERQGGQAARGARAPGCNDLRYSGIRFGPGPPAVFDVAEADRGKLETGKKLDHHYQRRARSAAAVVAAHHALEDRSRRSPAVLQLSERSVACAYP